MGGIELFVWVLAIFAWIVYMVVRRVMKPPRPLGTIAEEAPPATGASDVPGVPDPLQDLGWGRAPPLPSPVTAPAPAPVRVASVPVGEPFRWGSDAAQAELAAAREMARRQARARQVQAEQPRPRHPHRPRLRTTRELRDGIVLATVLGPCRAMQPYQPPEG